MSKKILSLALSLLMIFSLCAGLLACSDEAKVAKMTESPLGEKTFTKDFDIPADFKVGFILLHDQNSTYDLNFINAVNAAKSALGLTDEQVIFKINVPEGNECYEEAKNLVNMGCDVIFADSFGHEDFMIKAAKEFPDVQFCHATGTKAHTENLSNYHNAFASIYEGRFLAGIAAGMKLNEMIEAGKITAEQAKIGYVGAFTYAEVISGYTSFYLGAKSVCPSVTMDVQFTGSWYDENAEKSAAIALMDGGCVLISQHADSMGAPSACEERGVPNVSYNGSTHEDCPGTFIVSSKIDWTPYFMYMIKSVVTGTEIAVDWCGTSTTGSVVLSGVNETAAAEGTFAKLQETVAKLQAGTTKVFDCATFTVTKTETTNVKATVDANGRLTAYMADVDDMGDYAGDTNAIKTENGVTFFDESFFRSAPYFDLQIDGITLKNAKY